jgi:hypothetical protein
MLADLTCICCGAKGWNVVPINMGNLPIINVNESELTNTLKVLCGEECWKFIRQIQEKSKEKTNTCETFYDVIRSTQEEREACVALIFLKNQI